MTDLIKDALRHEADTTVAQPPDVDAIIAKGLRTRRTRAGLVGIAGFAVAGVVAATVVGGGGSSSRPDPGPADRTLSMHEASLATYRAVGPIIGGHTLQVGDIEVSVPAHFVSGLYPTQQGAVTKVDAEEDGVRFGALEYIDSNGVTHLLGKTGFDTVVGTDPNSDLVAWTEGYDRAGPFDIVVTDAVSGREVARTTVDEPTWEGWDTPAVALSGSTVYAHFAAGWKAWDYASGGEPVDVAGTQDATMIAGGILAERGDQGDVSFIRLSDGVVLSTISIGSEPFGQLSDDGLSFLVQGGSGDDTIYRTSIGTSVEIPSDPRTIAEYWAPDGDLIRLLRDRTALSCDPESGACSGLSATVPDGRLWLSGQTAER